MDAIIYVAGRSTRMGPAYAGLPKILLELGGRTLLEWHFRALQAIGVAKVYCVTGHLRDQVAAHLETLRRNYRMPVEEIVNSRFNEGSVLSVDVSLPVIQAATEPILLMDGDVLYDTRILRQLVHSKHRTALLVDFNFRDVDDDPVLVPVKNQVPFEFVKGWKGACDRVGESVGFFKLDPADAPVLLAETRARNQGLRISDSYDEVLRAMVKAGLFGVEDITGLPWTEIDFPTDLDWARETVLPAIQRAVQAAP